MQIQLWPILLYANYHIGISFNHHTQYSQSYEEQVLFYQHQHSKPQSIPQTFDLNMH